jgi:hypothetical protein
MQKRVNRRDFVIGAGAGAGLGALGVAALLIGRETPAGPNRKKRLKNGTVRDLKPQQTEEARKLAALLLPFRADSTVADSQLKSVSVDEYGMGVIILENPEGRSFRVDVCRLEAAVQPIAQSKHCALYLRNAGTGQTPTDESMGLSVMTLAAAIQSNESDRPALNLTTKSAFWARSKRS